MFISRSVFSYLFYFLKNIWASVAFTKLSSITNRAQVIIGNFAILLSPEAKMAGQSLDRTQSVHLIISEIDCGFDWDLFFYVSRISY